MKTLLITGTIKPYCRIEYNDIKQRLYEYEANIENYIRYSLFDKIIFAENSGFAFQYERFDKLAKLHGKQFEYINVSSTAEKENISIGDAKIILDAINKSKLIAGEFEIWKVSGRIWIKNINKILNNHKGRNIFLYSHKYDSVQTWLFKADTEVLIKFFLRKDVLEKMKNSCIEYVWKDCWSENINEFKIDRFPIYPNARGVNSSGNRYTVGTLKLFLKNILLKLGFYTVKERGKRCKY